MFQTTFNVELSEPAATGPVERTAVSRYLACRFTSEWGASFALHLSRPACSEDLESPCKVDLSQEAHTTGRWALFASRKNDIVAKHNDISYCQGQILGCVRRYPGQAPRLTWRSSCRQLARSSRESSSTMLTCSRKAQRSALQSTSRCARLQHPVRVIVARHGTKQPRHGSRRACQTACPTESALSKGSNRQSSARAPLDTPKFSD